MLSTLSDWNKWNDIFRSYRANREEWLLLFSIPFPNLLQKWKPSSETGFSKWIGQTAPPWSMLLVCRKCSGWTKRLLFISSCYSFARIRILLCLCASETGRLKHAAYHLRMITAWPAYNNVAARSFPGSLFFPPREKRHPGNGFDIVGGYAGISDFPLCLTVRYKQQYIRWRRQTNEDNKPEKVNRKVVYLWSLFLLGMHNTIIQPFVFLFHGHYC